MIGKIKGTLVEIDSATGLIETASGIFYRLFLPPTYQSKLLPAPVEIYTHLQVRDDAHVLFGFHSKNEYDLFLLLLSVSGVGPKTAYNVVSFSKPQELIAAIRQNEVDYFTRVPGLGKKTAMKIILELSQKLKEEFKMEKMYISDVDQTAVEALVSLGFKSQDAKGILSKLPKDLSLEDKIKEGLRLGNKRS